jgi:hypothetical protein
VSDACVAFTTTLNDNAAATCMLLELRTIKFSPPGEDTRVTVPLRFSANPEPVPYRHTGRDRGDRYCDPGSGTTAIPGGPCD